MIDINKYVTYNEQPVFCNKIDKMKIKNQTKT